MVSRRHKLGATVLAILLLLGTCMAIPPSQDKERKSGGPDTTHSTPGETPTTDAEVGGNATLTGSGDPDDEANSNASGESNPGAE